jgi:uncharacterized membrane protein
MPFQDQVGLRDAPGGTQVSPMLQRMVDLAATGFEAGGTLAMALGTIVALIQVLVRPVRGPRDIVLEFRQRLGRAIVLGLELLVAADILRTVSIKPTLNEVLVLGIIVGIRTFLSFSLEAELKGRWPWQASRRRPDELS